MDIKIKKNDKLLVIAPHADDESIGCGGLLCLYPKQCDLLLLTDGCKGHTTAKYSDENVLIKIREDEFKKALSIAGVRNYFLLKIEDGKVFQNKKIIYSFDISQYDYIFVPNKYESHLDHKAVFKIVKYMKKRQRAKASIIEYEVWTPLRHVTWFLDISKVANKKKKMIQQYKSQIADINYVDKGMALSCYRGMFNNMKYSEAFLYSDYSGIKKWLYDNLPESLKLKIKKLIIK